MPYYPTLKENATKQQIVDVFGGYNHNLKIAEGEFYEMMNLTSERYPLLSTRRKRSVVEELNGWMCAILAKEKLAVLYVPEQELADDGTMNAVLRYGNTETTFAFNASEQEEPYQMVSMGSYICVFPTKWWYNTADGTSGSMEALYQSSGAAIYTDSDGFIYGYRMVPCNADGSYLTFEIGGETYTRSFIPTTKPADGDPIVDGELYADNETKTIFEYDGKSGKWMPVPGYARIEAVGIGAHFSAGDFVTLSGFMVPRREDNFYEDDLNGRQEIVACGADFLVVKAYYTHTCGGGTGAAVRAQRRIPDMDFVIEAQNRLWGCKYGTVDGKLVNEIYASALGDFRNWNKFAGISTDSYAASVGTDGAWTGAVNYQGYPLFFKENCMHKVFVSATGAHQIQDYTMRGVQKGCWRSLCIANEILFYKHRDGICAYDGSSPVLISEALGEDSFTKAAIGAYGDRLYVHMRETEPVMSNGQIADYKETPRMFVYDIGLGIWNEENNPGGKQPRGFAVLGDSLYMLDGGPVYGKYKLYDLNGMDGTQENDVEWSATTGLIGYNSVEQMYISRFNLRVALLESSEMDVYVEYDSDGAWHHQGHIEGAGTRTFLLPVRPRRCDHFRIKLAGVGDVRLYSFAKIFESGSDVRC